MFVGTYRVLYDRVVGEHVLVGHLYGESALGTNSLDRSAHVDHSFRGEPRRADVERQERTCNSIQ